MRRTVSLAPIPDGAWEPAGPAGVEILTLNRDPDSGARTALIRSVPRPGVEHKAQYHHCEEEFLCLQGRFTFDGSTWMRPFSYACYPPYAVHGARVSVPGGYLLYLRTSGSTQAYAIPDPVRDEAYHHAEFPVVAPIVVRESPCDALAEPAAMDPGAPRVRRHVLRAQPESGAQATLWQFDAGAEDLFRDLPAASLEVLLFNAAPTPDQPPALACRSYGYYGPHDERPRVNADAPLFALVHLGNWD